MCLIYAKANYEQRFLPRPMSIDRVDRYAKFEVDKRISELIVRGKRGKLVTVTIFYI